MPQTIYCWRCEVGIPMLTEEEWELVAPGFENAMEQIMRYRSVPACNNQSMKEGFVLPLSTLASVPAPITGRES